MKSTQLGKSGQGSIPHPFSERLAEIRRLRYGERGRSSFARDLGIPVTSYIHYETDRVPPAELLVAAASLTETRLEWLLCGTGNRNEIAPGAISSHAQQVADDLLQLLASAPQLIPSAEEFVQLLARMEENTSLTSMKRWGGKTFDSLIPVIGSTAAGLARFWHELDTQSGGPDADARLEQMLDQHSRQTAHSSGKAISAAPQETETVSLVQFSEPTEQGILEFLDAAGLKTRYPGAVAWRIDGESMSPRYRDGDFVITSPNYPAVEMQPCVARQQGQIGVNCKLFQTDSEDILLIPISESSRVQKFPRRDLLWAWRVLASVRLH